MEEDIKILKNLKENVALFSVGWQPILKQEEKQAIENLINRNKELEEENKNYKKYAVMMSTEGLIINGVKFSFNDYIPKSKVEEKIEELKQERILKYDNYMGYKIESREQQDIDKKVQVLQELLEKRE